MKENILDRIAEVFWIAVKAAVATIIILVLLQIIPIDIRHTASVNVGQRGTWDVNIRQSDSSWSIRNTGSMSVSGDMSVQQAGSWGVGLSGYVSSGR